MRTSVAEGLLPDRPPAEVSFAVLGVVSAFGPGGALLPLGPNRRRALLAALLVDLGNPIPVARVIDLLWDRAPPPTAATMVHTTVAGLRRTLDEGRLRGARPLLVTRDGGYVLDADPGQLDMVRFERLLAQGRQLVEASPSRAATVLADALALWRGPALGGVEQAFARDTAARLEELRVQCAELRMTAELALGRHHDVVAELESLVARHPLRERLSAQLIVARYRCGRAADALAEYRRLRHTLDAELGVEPGPELRRLEVAVLRRSDDLEFRPPVATGVRPRGAALPVPISSFVGRERELAELSPSAGAPRLVTLTGTGGSGKTRLALEAASRIVHNGLAEALLVDLTSVTTPALFDDTVADALGVRVPPGRDLAATAAAALSGRETVLLLDNCEHLLDECAALVQALLAASTRLRVLATSREPLGVPGEQVFPVLPLEIADADEGSDHIEACAAVRLFTSRAAAARPGFVVAPDDLRLILDVCRRLDGLPLAIELAAGRAASIPLADLAGLLVDHFRLLDSAVRTSDARHRSLAATVSWSYDLLTEAERTLFARMAVFPAAFDGAAAKAMAASSGAPGDVVLLLSRLVTCSLIGLEDGGGAGTRYRLLETTRQFARECLTAAQLGDLRERHARHYLGLVQETRRHLFGAGSARWLARLHDESDNLRAALEWSFGPEGDPFAGVGLVRGLWHYWDLRGARSEGLHWVHAGLDAAGAENPVDRLELLSAGALLHLGRSDFDATRRLADEQRALARATGARAWEGNALAMVATVAWARGHSDRSQQLYEDAIAASIEGGDLWRAAIEEAQLARLHRDRNEPDAAKAVALQALAHAGEVGEELACGLAVNVLASLEHRWGDVSEARRLTSEALAHYRLVGYQEGEASALHLAGRIAFAEHEPEAAITAFEGSLRLCGQMGHRAGAAAALTGLASVATAAGDVGKAARLAGEAAALRAEIGLPLPG